MEQHGHIVRRAVIAAALALIAGAPPAIAQQPAPAAPRVLSTGGGWSAANWGRQLLITTPSGFSNPAIGITDAHGRNLWGIANSGGTLEFALMPEPGDHTTPPDVIATLSGGGLDVSHAYQAPHSPYWALIDSNDTINYRSDKPVRNKAFRALVVDHGDAHGDGTNTINMGGHFETHVFATDANSGALAPDSAFDFAIHPVVLKSNPPNGLPPGAALKNVEVEWGIYTGPNNPWSSMSGAQTYRENDYNVNGLDDVGNDAPFELEFSTGTQVTNHGRGWLTSIPHALSIAMTGTGGDAAIGGGTGALFFGDGIVMTANFSESLLNFRRTASYAPIITSATPAADAYSVTVDNILPLAFGDHGFNGYQAASAAHIIETTAPTTDAGAITMANLDNLGANWSRLQVFDLTHRAGIPLHTHVALFGASGKTLRLSGKVTVAARDRLLFSGATKQVTINGRTYTTLGVVPDGPGRTSGTVYFATALPPADAAHGVRIYPAAHAIWLCDGSAAAPWCDVAFNARGTATIRSDGSGGLAEFADGVLALRVRAGASTDVNHIAVVAGRPGSPAVIEAEGADASASISLRPKGTGTVIAPSLVLSGVTSAPCLGTTGTGTVRSVSCHEGAVRLPQATVAALPRCSAAERGLLYGVTDANSPAYNAPVRGGGEDAIPVYCNGTRWTAH